MSKPIYNDNTVQNTHERHLNRADIVIIGNGIAGLTAAVEARHLAPDKRIVIITDQLHPTINTPALKQFAIGKLTREQLLAYPAGTERTERIHVVNAHVEEIHAKSMYVKLQGGRDFGYDSLLLATGSSPMGLDKSIPGRGFDGVLTAHRLQDYLDLRRRINEISEAVVVGGGVHAIETVMGLLFWGIRVHWLIRGKTFMRNMLDDTASTMVLNNVQQAGAIVHRETEITGIVGRVGAVAGVVTNQQTMIPCQLVLTCTGTRAVTTLATQSTVPIMHKNGIIVDHKLRTNVRNIYAAGDVAALKNPLTGAFEPRAQWYAAVAQGRIAGAMMVGHQELASQPFGVHWHATHLGELSMLTVGEPLSKEAGITTLTDNSQKGYRRVTLRDDRLVGYLALGPAQPDSLAIKKIIDEGHSIQSVIKALLKGQFDARAYLSSQRTSEARNLATQKRSAVQLPERTGKWPTTGELLPQNTTHPRIERALPVQQTEPLSQKIPALNQAPVDLPLRYYEEEINPFTGNLPAVSIIGQPPIGQPPQQQNNKLWAYLDVEADPQHIGSSQLRKQGGQ